jgi:thiosulfate dehydrogenase
MLKGLVVGFILGVLLISVGVYFYFAAGFAPVAVTDPPMPFESWLARIGLHAVLAKQKQTEPPIVANEETYLAGAEVYRKNCAVCHGLPGEQPTAIASGMFPKPPGLFHGKGVTDDPAWETHWKAANGIRMTGMPGFKGTLNDPQLWQVSQLLANADKIPASVKKVLGEKGAG